MAWELRLISIYYWVCDHYNQSAFLEVQRMSNNATKLSPAFSDQEAIAVYLFGILQSHTEVKKIYEYTKNHLHSWFPTLPSYAKFNERLNRLSPALSVLSQKSLAEVSLPDWLKRTSSNMEAVIDSMPIILAKAGRADHAKVAKLLANKSYCATKKLFYHGVKLHQLGLVNPNCLPIPQCLLVTAGSESDNTVFKERIAPQFRDLTVYADKIYHDRPGNAAVKEAFNITVMPCQRRKKNEPNLNAFQKQFSTAVSRVRQPVESFFNWINEKTGIQIASKVRSLKGLLKHLWGKLTAALLIINGF